MTAIDARGATAVAIADGVRAGKLRARGVALTPSTPLTRRAAIRARSPAFRWG